jgi:hypothetical protein
MQGPTFDTESVVIDRAVPATNPVLKSRTVIYSGTCDFQSGAGSQYHNPSGVVDISDAWMAINALPAVQTGDRATVTQNGIETVYNVDSISVFTNPLPHTELLLKRGPGKNENR